MSFKPRFTSSSALLLTVSAIGWGSMAVGQEMCGQIATVSGDTETSLTACTGELLIEQGRMIDAVEGLVDEMEALAMTGAIASQSSLYRQIMNDDLSEKVRSLKAEHGRAIHASEAVSESDYEDAFEKADKEKGEKCTFSDVPFKESLDGELPPGLKPVDGDTLDDFDPRFGDGKCNVFKARIDDPGGADDDKIIQVHERRENMCETVCEDRTNPNNPNNPHTPRKKERKERVGGRLTDNIAATVRATDGINEARAKLAALRMQLAASNGRIAGSSDVCESGADPAEGFAIAATAVSIANSLVSFGTIIAETVKDSVEPPANQSVAGFNAGSAVIPFAVVAGGFKIAQEILSAVEKGLLLAGQIIATTRADTIELCLKSVRDDAVALKERMFAELKCVGGANDGLACATGDDCPDGQCDGGEILKLQMAAGDANAALAALSQDVAALKTLIETNQDMLRTPPGRREGFNDRKGSP